MRQPIILLPIGATEMEDNVREILSDPEQVEAARQQMLANPAMAEMLGVNKEVF